MALVRKAAIIAMGLAVALPAHAEGLISEVKGGVLAHDIRFLGSNKEGGVDLNIETLFAAPDLLQPIWSPRPHIGVQVNTDGDTSQAYAGLTWTVYPTTALPIWTAFSLGGAIHNGDTGGGDDDEKGLGSRALFRLGAEIGYDITPRLSVSLMLDHESNANLADENEGLNNLGIRFGYRF